MPIIIMDVIKCGGSTVVVKKHIKTFLVGVKVSEMYYFYKDLLKCGFWSIFYALFLTVPFLFFSFLNQSDFLTMGWTVCNYHHFCHRKTQEKYFLWKEKKKPGWMKSWSLAVSRRLLIITLPPPHEMTFSQSLHHFWDGLF